MTEAKPKRRWLRFSLRKLLLVVTLAALASWGYWIGWPGLVANWQQHVFEHSVASLHVGVRVRDTNEETFPFPPHKGDGEWGSLFDINGDRIWVGQYSLTNGVYFVCLKCPKGFQGEDYEAPSTRVEVFRLPPVPSNYAAKRKINDDPVAKLARPPSPGEPPDDAYYGDFVQFVFGDRKDDFGLKCELIYSDPPAKPIK
jgi:hypothetical protein